MNRCTAVSLLAALLLVFSGLGAAAEESENTSGTKVPTSTCLSGMKWTGGDEGSPEMHPGRSCVDCHATGEGPRFTIAGTVYRQLGEPNDCYGAAGVVVQVTDARGKVLRLTTNLAGNFFARAAVSFPLSAKVLFKGRESGMATRQQTGNCARCHTAEGANGAPGRIVAP
jgi:hypothetical protein